MGTALHVEKMTIGYGSEVVIDGLDIHAEAGELLTVIGPNGAGKSTLLRGLAGFHPMSFDSYFVDGISCAPESSDHKKWTHSVTDEWMWLEGLTLRDHLQLMAAPDNKAEQRETINNALTIFGLSNLANRIPTSFSSGQLQRAALSSIMTRPWKVLFLDEPEKRLDDEYQGLLSTLLPALARDRVIVVATHAPELFKDCTSQLIELKGR